MNSHLPKNHPMRFLIESAANGRKLTAGDMRILNRSDDYLPTGQSLSKYAPAIEAAAARVASIGATGNRQAALDAAQTEWGNLAGRLTAEQCALKDSSTPETDKEVTDMVTNLFNRNN